MPKPALVIYSKEGITQGDCLEMSLYNVALRPLMTKMHEEIPVALQLWYCDDAGAAGKAMPNVWCLNFLVKFGPPYSYFPKPRKLYYVCKVKDRPAVHQAFESFCLKINYLRG
jgi:hypothetical protein